MARDLNRVMLIGRLTQDLDVKKTETGRSVVNFTIATNRRFKNAEGNIVEEAEFHRCVAF
jgi:single-strand DNA-binding protein